MDRGTSVTGETFLGRNDNLKIAKVGRVVPALPRPEPEHGWLAAKKEARGL
jgi:hypothetical protein